MLPSRSGILAEATNTMEMQWVAWSCGHKEGCYVTTHQGERPLAIFAEELHRGCLTGL